MGATLTHPVCPQVVHLLSDGHHIVIWRSLNDSSQIQTDMVVRSDVVLRLESAGHPCFLVRGAHQIVLGQLDAGDCPIAQELLQLLDGDGEDIDLGWEVPSSVNYRAAEECGNGGEERCRKADDLEDAQHDLPECVGLRTE